MMKMYHFSDTVFLALRCCMVRCYASYSCYFVLLLAGWGLAVLVGGVYAL